MPTILIDCETYSEADLKLVGAENYANHPSTRVLMWGVRLDHWTSARVFEVPNIWKLLQLLQKEGELKWSEKDPLDVVHWGPFDRIIARARCIASVVEEWEEMDEMGAWAGPNNTRWGDLSEISMLFGGPVKLKWAAEFWSDHMLKEEGSHLISRFCKPNKAGQRTTGQMDPERWAQFKAYCARDVDASWEIMERLTEILEETGEDLQAHAEARSAVSAMNRRGAPLDLPALTRATRETEQIGARLKGAMLARHGVNVNAPAQVAAFLGTENAQRETLEDGLDEETSVDWSPAQVEVAEARLVVSGAAVKKLRSLIERATDGRVRDAFVYHGAWTRRATSMRPQLHNLVRQKIDPVFFDDLVCGKYDGDPGVFRLVRNNIRGFVKAPDGHELVAGDYAQIELRVAAWVAGEDWLVDALESGQDVYRITAGNIYYKPAMSVDTGERQLGKTVELGSQFGLSGTGPDGESGLRARLAKEGIEMSGSECKRIIQVYRDTHPAIVRAWKECEDAVYIAMHAPAGTEVTVLEGRVLITRTTNAIKVTRPSGFSQYLWHPRIEEGHWPDGAPREEMAYVGRGKGGGMTYMNTYGGKIFQGIVQGIAADVMYYGLALVEKADLLPVMSVHDELVCCPPIGRVTVEELCSLMCIAPEWAPRLPLKAEGGSGQRFTKF